MSTPRQRRIWSSRFLIASFALAAPGFVSSQATGTEIQTIAPSVVANSIHASRYGSASDCPRGFAKVAAACVAGQGARECLSECLRRRVGVRSGIPAARRAMRLRTRA